jgi:hypothetical protein
MIDIYLLLIDIYLLLLKLGVLTNRDIFEIFMTRPKDFLLANSRNASRI